MIKTNHPFQLGGSTLQPQMDYLSLSTYYELMIYLQGTLDVDVSYNF